MGGKDYADQEWVICPVCNGEGVNLGADRICTACAGEGEITVQEFNYKYIYDKEGITNEQTQG